MSDFVFSLLVEIIRYGDRETLKPYCTLIIIALFEALSSIEPDMFNYASMKLSAAELKEQVDTARLLCARSSPIMDAINTCTNQFVDENILDDLSSKLIETIKHSVGFTTKCLIGQYFMTLTNLYPKICSKYVGKWMAVLVNTMSVNSNRTLRKTYTNVLGTIVRIAKRSSIENLLQKISTWYFQTENDYQYVCALTLNSISQSNHDMLLEFGQQILPLIFLAMQEKSLTVKQEDEQQEEFIWMNLWTEHTGSSASGIQTYIKGIREQIRLAIDHSSYPMRIKGARAIQMIGETLKTNLNGEDLFELVEFLLKGLYGRVYEGKVSVLWETNSLSIVSLRNVFFERWKPSAFIASKDCSDQMLIVEENRDLQEQALDSYILPRGSSRRVNPRFLPQLMQSLWEITMDDVVMSRGGEIFTAIALCLCFWHKNTRHCLVTINMWLIGRMLQRERTPLVRL